MAKKRKKKTNLEKVLTVRVNKAEFSKLKAMAKMYAEGSMSAWLRHCINEYRPKLIKKGA